MEKYEQQSINQLENFKKEIARIKEEEIRKKKQGEHYDIHFDNINPDELNELDMKIYNEFNQKTLTREKLDYYNLEIKKHPPSEVVSSAYFHAWLRNILSHPSNLKWFDPEMYERLPERIKNKYK